MLTDNKTKSTKSIMLNDSKNVQPVNEFDCNDECPLRKSIYNTNPRSTKSKNTHSRSFDRFSKINSPKQSVTLSQAIPRKPKTYTMPSQSCQKEKADLKHQITHLQERIDSQNQEIQVMRKQLQEEMVDNEKLAQQVKSTMNVEELETTMQEQRYQIYNLKTRELQLCEELNEQQMISKEALMKLYHYKETQQQEREELVELMELRCAELVEDAAAKWKKQLKMLEYTVEDQKTIIRQLESQNSQLKIQQSIRRISPQKPERLVEGQHTLRDQQIRSKQLEQDAFKLRRDAGQSSEQQLKKQIDQLKLELLYKDQIIHEQKLLH